MLDLPRLLVEEIQNGNVGLMLGSGASKGALHPKGFVPPDSKKLAERISRKYLNDTFVGRPLEIVSELAISQTDLFTVQSFIADIFNDFEPASFHQLLPSFPWTAIATTNYDRIIEKAYEKNTKRIQNLAVFIREGERIESKLRSRDTVAYFKLHGCVTCINDLRLPLILTPDQYITHKVNRARLFERVESLMMEYPFVFVGHSLSDLDIRKILLGLDRLEQARPRSFIVMPTVSPEEEAFWERKKLSTIRATFEDFLTTLNGTIPDSFRSIYKFTNTEENPITRRFKVREPSERHSGLYSFLERDVYYVHGAMAVEAVEARQFYKGYSGDFGGIAVELDVHRAINDKVIEAIMLRDEVGRDRTELVVIKGHAGSGKSICLKRIAWDSACDFQKLCLFVRPQSVLPYEYLHQTYNLCKERIHLFIDPASEYRDGIDQLLTLAEKDKMLLTIVTAERYNEWNDKCAQLESYVTQVFEVKYLLPKEVEGLLALLTKHSSLGHLAGLPLAKQMEELSERAGRQLLVALHEATMGKPFSDIVLDEYNSIEDSNARALYLTVCIFHRLGVQTRAGLISRVHRIKFEDFKERLFRPLEFIVFAVKDDIIHDYYYRTRHQHIAEIVFERALTSQQERFDEYMRILKFIDVDYQADSSAFRGLTNAKEISELFSDPILVRQFYVAARIRDRDNASLVQQEAIYEMNRPGGDLARASSLVAHAIELAPYNKAIAHSFAEVAFSKARKAKNLIEKRKYYEEAKENARKIIGSGTAGSYAYHTLVKATFAELEELSNDDNPRDAEQAIKELEELLERTHQRFPDDPFILDTESRYADYLRNYPRAVTLLDQAFETNRQSPYIAIRLAKKLAQDGNSERAISVLKQCVDRNPADKHVNYALADILEKTGSASRAEIKHHLRRSFTDGDTNFIAQFRYARHLFIDGEIQDARRLFGDLKEVRVDPRVKREFRGYIMDSGVKKRFSGQVTRIEPTYAFIKRDGTLDDIFVDPRGTDEATWSGMRRGNRIAFFLTFNYLGPVAVELEREF